MDVDDAVGGPGDELGGVGAAECQVARVEAEGDPGLLDDAPDLGLALDQRPPVRVERMFEAVLLGDTVE